METEDIGQKKKTVLFHLKKRLTNFLSLSDYSDICFFFPAKKIRRKKTHYLIFHEF